MTKQILTFKDADGNAKYYQNVTDVKVIDVKENLSLTVKHTTGLTAHTVVKKGDLLTYINDYLTSTTAGELILRKYELY